VDWFCAQSRLDFALDPEVVWNKFVEAGYRPEALQAAREVLEYSMIDEAAAGNLAFAQAVDEHVREMSESALAVIRSLTPIQAAVLKVMAVQGKDYAPFELATLGKYADMLRLAGMSEAEAQEAAYAQNVQQALAALQEKALIWKAERGVYAIEEQGLPDLMRSVGMLPDASSS